MAVGLFIGLTTLDFIYLTHSVPKSNQKLVAIDAMTVSGGPATNAAVAFQSLSNQSRLLSAIGQHSSSQMIRQDLKELDLWDLSPESLESPAISSILVTQSTGDRAVISINAKRFPISQLPDHLSAIEALSFTPNGLHLISRDRNQLVLFWDLTQYRSDRSISLASGNQPKPIDTSDAIATQDPITLSPDGQTFAVPLKLPNGTLALDLRQVMNGDRLTVLPHASHATFTPDHQFLVTGNSQLQIWQP